MTVGVIGDEESLLAEQFVQALESAGHDCLVLENIDYATRVLRAIRIDSIVLDIDMSGGDGLAWLETMVASRPDLPGRTLLLARSALTPGQATRVKKLGVTVALRPSSPAGVEAVVKAYLQDTRFEPAGLSQRGRKQEPPVGTLNWAEGSTTNSGGLDADA